MNMFVWRSDWLKDYGTGLIVVKANTVKGARIIATAHFLEWFYKTEVKPYDYNKKGLLFFLLEDKDQLAYFRESYEKFVDDIEKEPEETVVLFEPGSS